MTTTDPTGHASLELYHFDRSSAARKVRIALAEKGLDWTSHILDTSVARREHHDRDYLRLNPRGVVPTLVHEGKVVRESQVILEYLEDVFPEPPLRPADPYERSQMRLWTKRADEDMHRQARTLAVCIYMGTMFLESGQDAVTAYYEAMPDSTRRDNDRIDIEYGLESPLLPRAVAYFKDNFTEMDETLRDKDWLAGSSYSLADISMGVYVTRLTGLGMQPLWSNLSALVEWHERFRSRPAYAEAVEAWGDRSSGQRIAAADAAFETMQALWEAA
ncbi:MAG TPA: glutathione S-transferase family protein [Gammaproteobacteria bacterium]